MPDVLFTIFNLEFSVYVKFLFAVGFSIFFFL